jgi:hypothetical protein
VHFNTPSGLSGGDISQSSLRDREDDLALYMATRGFLMRPAVISRLGQSGPKDLPSGLADKLIHSKDDLSVFTFEQIASRTDIYSRD